jgi:hypothetical protein
MAGPQRLDYTYKPIYWRLRAEETRANAEAMTIPECRDRLLRVADEYESVARCLEQMLRDLLGHESNGATPDHAHNIRPFRPTG